MPVRKRGNIWYCDYINATGKRVRKSLGTTNKAFAQELYDHLKASSWRESRLKEPLPMLFEQAVALWLRDKQDKRSIGDDKIRLDFWLTHFKGIYLSDIDEKMIYDAVRDMTNRKHEMNWRSMMASSQNRDETPLKFHPKPASNATKSAHLAVIKALLRKAEFDWKCLQKAPHIAIQKPKNERVRWLKPYEAKRLIYECPEPLKSVVIFALNTGLRRSNIINLRWDNVDLERRVAYVDAKQSKSGRAIGVALNQTALDILTKQKGNHPAWVFVHQKGAYDKTGKALPASRIMRIDNNTAWRSALKRAGIEDFRFHDLRHTWASWLVQAGVPLFVVQEMGGWESIEMVRRYAHLSPNHLSEYAKRLDQYFNVE